MKNLTGLTPQRSSMTRHGNGGRDHRGALKWQRYGAPIAPGPLSEWDLWNIMVLRLAITFRVTAPKQRTR